MAFRISEKYRLELRWGKVSYKTDGEAVLTGCCFSGPVIKEVTQMNQQDYMELDFGNQYIVFVSRFYIASLSWGGVKHTADKIYLYNVILKNKYVNSVPKLNDNDYIIIDTANHEDEKHQHNLVYPSYLLRCDGESYNFKG